MTIIKIHGCSGAGKTTAVRQLMSRFSAPVAILNASNRIEAYELIGLTERHIFVLGSYENNCGGMDTISSAKAVMDLLEKYARKGHVVFEGLLQSTYYGAMGTHSLQWGQDYVYAFLDTPIEKCLERVEARRAAQGSTNKFNPQLTRDKHATISRLQKRVTSMGHRTITLDHDGDLSTALLRAME